MTSVRKIGNCQSSQASRNRRSWIAVNATTGLASSMGIRPISIVRNGFPTHGGRCR